MKRFLLLCILLSSLIMGYDLQISEDGNTFSKSVLFQNNVIRAQQNFTFESSAITITSFSRFGPFSREEAEQNQNDVESLDKSLLIDSRSLSNLDDLEINSNVEEIDGSFYLTISQSTGIHDASFTLKCDVTDFDEIKNSMDVTQTIAELDAQIQSAGEVARTSLEQEKEFIIEFAKWQQDRVSNFEKNCEDEEVIVAEVICEGGEIVNGECTCNNGYQKRNLVLNNEPGYFCFNPCGHAGSDPQFRKVGPNGQYTEVFCTESDEFGTTQEVTAWDCVYDTHKYIAEFNKCVPEEFVRSGVANLYFKGNYGCEDGYHRAFGHYWDIRKDNSFKFTSDCYRVLPGGEFRTEEEDRAIANGERECGIVNVLTGETRFLSAEECENGQLDSNELMYEADSQSVPISAPSSKHLRYTNAMMQKYLKKSDFITLKNSLKSDLITVWQFAVNLPDLLINAPKAIRDLVRSELKQDLSSAARKRLATQSIMELVRKSDDKWLETEAFARERSAEANVQWNKLEEYGRARSQQADQKWAKFMNEDVPKYTDRLNKRWDKILEYAKGITHTKTRLTIYLEREHDKAKKDLEKLQKINEEILGSIDTEANLNEYTQTIQARDQAIVESEMYASQKDNLYGDASFIELYEFENEGKTNWDDILTSKQKYLNGGKR